MRINRTAIASTALLLCASSLAAQRPRQPAQPAARPDTTRQDSTRRDALSRFVESVNVRALGPAAYSGRVTAIAVPSSREPRPKTFYIGSAGGG
ncbi:MAG: hypothetical protein Q8Q85_02595, partial [Gemmatimonadales bacterium]|nr:hypothetical protein [Gemmatimonadales bacterium]